MRRFAFVLLLLASACGKQAESNAATEPAAPSAAPAGQPAAAEAAAPAAAPAAAAPAAPAAAVVPAAAQPATQQAAGESAKPAAAPGDKAALDVHIVASGVTMKFDITKITAAAGQRVHVVLENKLPGTLSHNWVLVRAGTEAAVAAEGLKAGLDGGYLVEGPSVLAHLKMVPPGQSSEVTFDAPKEPGNYPYICTFPGHYLMMKGVLEVTP